VARPGDEDQVKIACRDYSEVEKISVLASSPSDRAAVVCHRHAEWFAEQVSPQIDLPHRQIIATRHHAFIHAGDRLLGQ
jgi:hypothetical protein